MRRTKSLHNGFSDMSAVAAAASKTPREEILERDFLNKKENKYPQLVKYKYRQKQGKWITIPIKIKEQLEKIRDSLKKKDKIQYVGINEMLKLRNLDEINYVFEDTLRGLNDFPSKKEHDKLVEIWKILNTEIKKVEVSNMRKYALRNSRKKKKKKGGRRTRGKKRKQKGGNKRQIQINANQIKKNSQNLKKLKLRMERCACKEEEEEDDGYDKLRRSDFLSDIELKPPPEPIKQKKENRSESPTSIMDEPTGAAALALRMGGGYPQKRRRQQKGGERTPGNWIKYNEILLTDRCIRCNEQLMNPQSPEKTAYMMMCGCVVHTECISNFCRTQAANDDDLICPGVIGEDEAGEIICGLEIWESCTDVDEYLLEIQRRRAGIEIDPNIGWGMDPDSDILKNPNNYWTRESDREEREEIEERGEKAPRPHGGKRTRRKRKKRKNRKTKKRRRKQTRKRRKRRQ